MEEQREEAMGVRGVRQRWELDIIGGGNRLRRGSEGGRGRGEGRYKARRRRRKKGWRTTRKSREELTQSEGEVKEESRRRGGRGRASMWLKRNEEDGRREGLASQGQKKKARRGTRRERERGRERGKKRAHGHRKSGALHSHAKSSDGVFTPRRCRNQMHPAPFKSLLPTISSCSHVGRELESRQKSSVSAANVLGNKCALQSKKRVWRV